jgi:RNA polymerase sigma-70 factor, ECF subfamily
VHDAPREHAVEPAERPDEDLVGACLAADAVAAAGAFEELYRRHAPSVLAFLLGLHRGDEHAGHDALQETFLRFYDSLASFDRGRRVRPWLLRIARNASLDAWKRAERRTGVAPDLDLGEVVSSGAGPAEAAAEREAAGLLRSAVLALPEAELAVFLLKHDQGLTYAEVAEALGCSLRTGKYRMKAALERLGRAAERLGVES